MLSVEMLRAVEYFVDLAVAFSHLFRIRKVTVIRIDVLLIRDGQ